ncbi:hypothetical protein [Natrarchaeobius chitinivorans]|uniref:Uncharacterized protein n=1 Tax=Natrarchaeobius chitinivorans TaxID=1679083 RepID=A0A3N6PAF7_NATCH|nr:hypothetical protein [Natrarchaeobius chitinivorans]RQG93395.1 hypothetical protein EA473_15310 [Natrarchaeobius chitinivorans]
MSSDTDPVPTAKPLPRPDEPDRDDRASVGCDAVVPETDESGRDDDDPSPASSASRDGSGVARCGTCGAAIGPRAYRLSRIVTDGTETTATHYCSKTCFPDESTLEREESSRRSRDWSYCR